MDDFFSNLVNQKRRYKMSKELERLQNELLIVDTHHEEKLKL